MRACDYCIFLLKKIVIAKWHSNSIYILVCDFSWSDKYIIFIFSILYYFYSGGVKVSIFYLRHCFLIHYNLIWQSLYKEKIILFNKLLNNKVKSITDYLFYYSNTSNTMKPHKINMSDDEFNHWFTGFSDPHISLRSIYGGPRYGESTFYIIISNNVISFRFSIKLHIDDFDTLEFIKNRLNCGNIYCSETSASFELNNINDIKTKLLPLFKNFPLNGIKYLDYLSFKKAIELKDNDKLSKDIKLEWIRELKNSMNSKRTDFIMPGDHNINITPYWLLGLIEGEGTFCLMNSKTFGVSFSLSLTASQTPLINAIKEYLGILLIKNSNIEPFIEYKEILNKIIFVYNREKRLENDKPTIEITIKQVQFIVDKFIPMLDNLSFVTKKYKDFLDWAFIVLLINKGKHTTDAGKNLIIQISKSMNAKRLSTFNQTEFDLINEKLINQVLNMEDIYIKNEEGLRIKAKDFTLVNRQLFYLLAEGSNGENLVFSSSEAFLRSKIL